MTRRTFPLVLLTLLLALPACRTRDIENPAQYGTKNSTTLEARAPLAAKSGSSVAGEVTFRQLVTAHSEAKAAFPEVLTYARVAGLTEGAAYTLRVHDATHCDAPAAKADAGHNARTLTADADGEATLAASLSKVTLVPEDARQLVGRSIVVHEGTAETGTPVACGVIEAVEAKVAVKK